MGRYRHVANEVVVSVDDSKDERFDADPVWEAVDSGSTKKTPAKKAASSKSDN